MVQARFVKAIHDIQARLDKPAEPHIFRAPSGQAFNGMRIGLDKLKRLL
jgi:hypothetical protein